MLVVLDRKMLETTLKWDTSLYLTLLICHYQLVFVESGMAKQHNFNDVLFMIVNSIYVSNSFGHSKSLLCHRGGTSLIYCYLKKHY